MKEDDQIDFIGRTALKLRAAVMLESEEVRPGKIDRYISKLKAKFPTVSLISRIPGPIPGVEMLVFAVIKYDA